VRTQLYTTHVVEQGEDIFKLAELYYGDAGAWWVIYHANLEDLGDDPEELSPGVTLRIPALETSQETEAMPSFVPATSFEHSKDPLIQFAAAYYGDPSLAFDIRELNGLTDDQVIIAGTELRMPPRGVPRNLSRAAFYRQKFYRVWVKGLS